MSWYSYQYKSFMDHIENRDDWRQDNMLSIRINDVSLSYFEQNSNYFDLAVNEAMEFIDEKAPDLVKSYTPVMTAGFLNFQNISESDYNVTELLGIGGEPISLLPQCLIEGKIPENTHEILYLPSNRSKPLYAVNDTIHLKNSDFLFSEVQNFTVVGILDNLLNVFYKAGFSSDILVRNYYNHYFPDEGDETYQYADTFITTSQYLSQIVTNYVLYQGNINIKIDLDYQITSSNIRNLNKLHDEFVSVQFSFNDFQYLPSYIDSFCYDLLNEIIMFQSKWTFKTVLVFASGIPLIFLFALICTETFHIGDHEKMSKFKLIKVHGLEFKTLRRMLFLENLLVSTIGLTAGFSLGLLFGYFASIGMGSTNFGNYFTVLAEPVIIVAVVALFVALSFVGFIIENSLAKKSAQTTAEMYKRKRRKFIRKVFSTQEFIILMPGLVLIAIGYVGMMFSFMFYMLPGRIFESLQVTFMFLMSVGALLVISSIFILFSRIVRLLWQAIGKFSWKKRKSYFTLSLKHLSIYNTNYTRSILAMFMICLAITPGLIVKRSVNEHVPLETNLTMGYSDILVSKWDIQNQQIIGNISDIEGVELVTGVTTMSLFDSNEYQRFERGFDITILSIHNVSEYKQIINQSILEKTHYSIEDIEQLENNMTFMMSTKFAKEKKYDEHEIFLSTKFTSPTYEPYEMIYVNSFDYFPLLRRQSTNFYSRYYDRYSLVVSNLTLSQLIPKLSYSTNAYGDHNLLVKISDTGNATVICETIESFGLSTVIKDELEQSMFLQIDDFFIVFFVIIAIIAMLALVFFGYITAKNIYAYRLRIIESEYQVGAQRKQIWGSFTIEFALIIFIPLIISTVVNSLLVNSVLGTLLNVKENFTKFDPWLPFWLTLLIIILCLVLIISGWIVEIIHRVNKYRPIKQE